MDTFRFAEPAELFVGYDHRRVRSPMIYKRFATGAEAIRHAVERQSARELAASILQVDELRVKGAEIQSLYESAGYPLPRRLYP